MGGYYTDITESPDYREGFQDGYKQGKEEAQQQAVEQARQEETERCCKDVCPYCEEGFPIKILPHEFIKGRVEYCHEYLDKDFMPKCNAHIIRLRAAKQAAELSKEGENPITPI